MQSSEEYAARVSLSGKLEEAGLEQKPGEPVKLKRPRIVGGAAPETVINLDLPEDEGLEQCFNIANRQIAPELVRARERMDETGGTTYRGAPLPLKGVPL